MDLQRLKRLGFPGNNNRIPKRELYVIRGQKPCLAPEAGTCRLQQIRRLPESAPCQDSWIPKIHHTLARTATAIAWTYLPNEISLRYTIIHALDKGGTGKMLLPVLNAALEVVFCNNVKILAADVNVNVGDGARSSP